MKVRIENTVNIFTLTDFPSINRYRLSYNTEQWNDAESQMELIRNEDDSLTIAYNDKLIRSLIANISGVKVNIIDSSSSSFTVETNDKYLLYLLNNKKDLYLYGKILNK